MSWVPLVILLLGFGTAAAQPSVSTPRPGVRVNVPVPSVPRPELANLPPARTLLVTGQLPGFPDGKVLLAFSIFKDEQDTKSLTDRPITQEVAVEKGVFTVSLGSNRYSPLDPKLFARDSLWVGYAVASDPGKQLGNRIPLRASAYAFSLNPGATIVDAGSRNAILEVSREAKPDPGRQDGPAILSRTQGSSAAGVFTIESSGQATAAAALVAQSNSSSAPAAQFVNTGGGDILQAKANPAGPPVFRVTADGQIYYQDAQLWISGDPGDFGPQGYQGARGGKGPRGKQGLDGPKGGPGRFQKTFAVCSASEYLITACPPGTKKIKSAMSVALSSDAPPPGCDIGSDTGTCGIQRGNVGSCLECKIE